MVWQYCSPIRVGRNGGGAGTLWFSPGHSIWFSTKAQHAERPICVNFSGGAADKNGTLKVGDEILSVNSVDVTRMTRLEAWNFMKKLNDGNQVVTVRQKLQQQQQQQQQQVVTVVVTGSNSSVPLVKTELVADATTTSCRAEKTH
jgi:C-terminal processing protease CtpA/Prc